jgi:hypothetical protein
MYKTPTFIAFKYSKAFTYSGPISLGMFDVVITSIREFSLCFDSLMILLRIPVSKKFKLFEHFI